MIYRDCADPNPGPDSAQVDAFRPIADKRHGKGASLRRVYVPESAGVWMLAGIRQ